MDIVNCHQVWFVLDIKGDKYKSTNHFVIIVNQLKNVLEKIGKCCDSQKNKEKSRLCL